MNSEKYIGLDVHQATISVAVMDSKGNFLVAHSGHRRLDRGVRIVSPCIVSP